MTGQLLCVSLAHCRIGNLLMPDENYVTFYDWIKPILKQMLLEQNTQVCGLYFEHLSACLFKMFYTVGIGNTN